MEKIIFSLIAIKSLKSKVTLNVLRRCRNIFDPVIP